MNTQIENILNQNGTKTVKIKQLLLLGISRTKVAELVMGTRYSCR